MNTTTAFPCSLPLPSHLCLPQPRRQQEQQQLQQYKAFFKRLVGGILIGGLCLLNIWSNVAAIALAHNNHNEKCCVGVGFKDTAAVAAAAAVVTPYSSAESLFLKEEKINIDKNVHVGFTQDPAKSEEKHLQEHKTSFTSTTEIATTTNINQSQQALQTASLSLHRYPPREVAHCRWQGYLDRINKHKKKRQQNNNSNDDGGDDATTLKYTNPFCQAAFSVSRPIRPKNRQQEQHRNHQRVALCAVHAQGERYIDEWTDYHLALGFDPIIIFDNSKDFSLETWAAVKLQEEEGRVQVFHGPGEAMQKKHYLKCFKKLQQQQQSPSAYVNVTWLAYLDLDEYLVLRKHSNVADFLHQHLPVTNNDGGNKPVPGSLAINWLLFGASSNGNAEMMTLTYEPLPVTRRIQTRIPVVNRHVKTIHKFDAIKEPLIHYARLKSSYTTTATTTGDNSNTGIVDTSGRFLAKLGPEHAEGTVEVAAVHHYFSMSLEEFYLKACIRGRATMKKNTHCDKPLRHYHERAATYTMQDATAFESLVRMLPEYGEFQDLR